MPFVLDDSHFCVVILCGTEFYLHKIHRPDWQLQKGIAHYNLLSYAFDFLVVFLFVFSSASFLSLKSFDIVGALETTLVEGNYYPLSTKYEDMTIVSNFKITNREFHQMMSHDFGETNVFYGCSAFNNEDQYVYFIDDETMDDSGVALDYETYLSLGEPTEIKITGDFYDFVLPVRDFNYPKKGIFVSSSFLDVYESNYVNVLGGDGIEYSYSQAGFFSQARRYVSLSFAKEHIWIDADDIELSNQEIWFNSNSGNTLFDRIHFYSISTSDSTVGLEDKFIDMFSLFPDGLETVDSEIATNSYPPYAVVSDWNYQRILADTHSYRLLAVQCTGSNRRSLAIAMSPYNNAYTSLPYDETFEVLSNYRVQRSGENRQYVYLWVICNASFLAYAIFIGVSTFSRNEKDYVRMRLSGKSKLCSLAFFLIPKLVSTILGCLLGVVGARFLVEILNARPTPYWFSLYQFVPESIIYAGIALGMVMAIFSLAFLWADHRKPLETRIRGISQ